MSKGLGDKLRASAAFSAIHNGEARETERDREYSFANRYLLSPAVTPERFTEAGLRTSIGESIDLLASPTGMLLKSVLARGCIPGPSKRTSAIGITGIPRDLA